MGFWEANNAFSHKVACDNSLDAKISWQPFVIKRTGQFYDD